MADFHCTGKEVEVMEELIMTDRGIDRVSGQDLNTTALTVSTPDEVVGLRSDMRAEQVDKCQHEHLGLTVQLSQGQLCDLLT